MSSYLGALFQKMDVSCEPHLFGANKEEGTLYTEAKAVYQSKPTAAISIPKLTNFAGELHQFAANVLRSFPQIIFDAIERMIDIQLRVLTPLPSRLMKLDLQRYPSAFSISQHCSNRIL